MHRLLTAASDVSSGEVGVRPRESCGMDVDAVIGRHGLMMCAEGKRLGADGVRRHEALSAAAETLGGRSDGLNPPRTAARSCGSKTRGPMRVLVEAKQKDETEVIRPSINHLLKNRSE